MVEAEEQDITEEIEEEVVEEEIEEEAVEEVIMNSIIEGGIEESRLEDTIINTEISLAKIIQRRILKEIKFIILMDLMSKDSILKI